VPAVSARRHLIDGGFAGVQDVDMRRLAAAFAFVFVASLTLAAYGHCWPMLVAQIEMMVDFMLADSLGD